MAWIYHYVRTVPPRNRGPLEERGPTKCLGQGGPAKPSQADTTAVPPELPLNAGRFSCRLFWQCFNS